MITDYQKDLILQYTEDSYEWVNEDLRKKEGILTNTLTSTLKVGEGSAGFGLCARLWRKPTEPLTVLYVDVKIHIN